MSKKGRILVVEDQESERNALERVLRVAQYDVRDDACLPPADSLPGGVPLTVRTN